MHPKNRLMADSVDPDQTAPRGALLAEPFLYQYLEILSCYRLAPQVPEQNSSYSHPAGSLDLSDSDLDVGKDKVCKIVKCMSN